MFTDFLNVTKFIESMSKAWRYITHDNVIAIEPATHLVQVSEPDGKLSTRENGHHSHFVQSLLIILYVRLFHNYAAIRFRSMNMLTCFKQFDHIRIIVCLFEY